MAKSSAILDGKKVLLFEPGKRGHCPTILRYTQESCRRLGLSFETVDTRTFRDGELIARLDEVGHASNCSILHLLTLDGLGNALAAHWLRNHRGGLPIAGNYYLYNNLTKGWRSLVWKIMLNRHVPSVVGVSDLRVRASQRADSVPRQVCYLPDPWWEKELQVTRDSGPTDMATFLAFGELSQRKGIDILCEAWLRYKASGGGGRLVLAGRLSTEIVSLVKSLAAKERSVTLVDRFIEEAEISDFYARCHFVVCPYPRSFLVSSGTVTRAMAVGRPVIVPSHGALGQMVAGKQCGLAFAGGDASSLARCLLDAEGISRSRFFLDYCAIAKELADERELASYTTYLGAMYERALEISGNR